ncbi:MAG: DNA ligase, partial [Bacteroidota bacterium]|nr:DNA ligase [Bacteroidota bacterium]
YVPASGKYLYEELKDFAHEVCLRVNGRLSATTTLQRSLSKRDRSQIYLDYLQNSRSQTIASVYSLRPRPGATVSTPLDWKEVRKGLTPGEFTIQNTLQRVRRQGDFFNNVLGKGIDLKKCVRALPAQ